MCILDHMQGTFFCLGQFLWKLADDQRSSITKGSIIPNMYIQPLAWKRIDQKLDGLWKCLLCFIICTYCFFTLWGSCTKHLATYNPYFTNVSLQPNYVDNIHNKLHYWKYITRTKLASSWCVPYKCCHAVQSGSLSATLSTQ